MAPSRWSLCLNKMDDILAVVALEVREFIWGGGGGGEGRPCICRMETTKWEEHERGK